MHIALGFRSGLEPSRETRVHILNLKGFHCFFGEFFSTKYSEIFAFHRGQSILTHYI